MIISRETIASLNGRTRQTQITYDKALEVEKKSTYYTNRLVETPTGPKPRRGPNAYQAKFAARFGGKRSQRKERIDTSRYNGLRDPFQGVGVKQPQKRRKWFRNTQAASSAVEFRVRQGETGSVGIVTPKDNIYLLEEHIY